jgi:uncharacterized membrane protein
MVIMALDHVRDFLHAQVTPDGHDFQDPTNLLQTTPFLFFTRFITHYCAPTFVLLTGTSAYLIGQRKSKKELSSFLIKRGIWLVLVELLLMSLAFSFDPLYHVLFLQVIWVIGWSMIILGLMIWLPYPVILVTGLVLFFGHNYLDQINLPDNVKNSPLGMMLYYSYNFMITISPGRVIIVLYALIPWLGVMLLGYCLGKLYESGVEAARRRRILTGLVFGLVIVSFLFWYFNMYGDQVAWTQAAGEQYINHFFFTIVTKYPASLLFYV